MFLGGIYVQIFSGFLHPILFNKKYEYLPLMAYSVYCSFFLLILTVRIYSRIIRN